MDDKYKLTKEAIEALRYLHRKSADVSEGIRRQNPQEMAFRFGQFSQDFTRILSEMGVFTPDHLKEDSI